MTPQKTYWHLLDPKRMPTEYEITSSRLHSYTARGFEVDVPLKAWYRRYQQASPIVCDDWEQFVDPRETTYTTYTTLQSAKEIYVDGLLQSIETSHYDKGLSGAWIETLSQILAPLRYPFHGFQMIASYIGQMAPSSRLTLASLFQAADEIRRVQRIAYRMKQLQLAHPGFGADSQSLWEKDPRWQPLREAVEKLLVTYDWAEALVGLNLVLKPLMDDFFLVHFSALARTKGDNRLGDIFASLHEDCQWHQAWSRAWFDFVVKSRIENKTAVQGWIDKWAPLAMRAARAFSPVFGSFPEMKIAGWKG